MECVVANVEHMRFDIEIALDEQYGALSLPFTGMDSMSFYISAFILVDCVRLSLRTVYLIIFLCPLFQRIKIDGMTFLIDIVLICNNKFYD